MADEGAPASPAAPASPSAAPPAESPTAASYPRVEALQPIGPPSSEDYAQVPALRAALVDAVPAAATLWGAKLMDPDDKAGATVLGKCVAGPKQAAALLAGPPDRRPRPQRLTRRPSATQVPARA